MNHEGEITALARRWTGGDEEALEQLIELTYPKLRRLARSHVRSDEGSNTLNTTSLVHEAYIRIEGHQNGAWPSRSHFYAFCSKVMRRVLIDYARRHNAEKRGGALMRVPLAEDMVAVESQSAGILEIEAALNDLAEKSERMARVVECRFFGGMSIAETAEALDASPRTVVREWTRARSYLLHALGACQERADLPHHDE